MPIARRRPEAVAALVLVVLAASACGAATPQPETYTLDPAGVVTARDPDKLLYTVEGHSGQLAVDKFIGPGAAAGDVIYTVEGHPGWAFTAYTIGPACWVIRGEAHMDGEFIKVLSTGDETLPDLYVRVPKSPDFPPPDALTPNDLARVIGNAVCVDSKGIAVLAQ